MKGTGRGPFEYARVRVAASGKVSVYTGACEMGQGLSTALCTALLRLGREAGADSAYLQVDADNVAARTVYGRLGFSDQYAYHYRCREAGAH